MNLAGSGFYFKPTAAAFAMAIAAGFYEETISGVLIMKENRLSNNHPMVSMILVLI